MDEILILKLLHHSQSHSGTDFFSEIKNSQPKLHIFLTNYFRVLLLKVYKFNKTPSRAEAAFVASLSVLTNLVPQPPQGYN